MKILFLNHNVIWHGAFLRAYHWGRQLVAKGHEVTVLTIDESNKWRFKSEDRDGVRLVRSPDLFSGKLRSGWDPWDTFRRVGYLLPTSYDLVHCVDTRPVAIFPALALKKFRRMKLVIDWGDWWGRGGTINERADGLAERLFAPVETLFEEAFRKFADGTVVLTSALERRAVSLGVSPESILRIPTGADIQRIAPLDKCAARQELGIPQETQILGYVGLLFDSDVGLLVEAFRILYARDSRVRLFLIGNTNIRVPRELTESGAVVFTGSLSYEMLQKYIACCDVMVLPLNKSVANVGRWPSKVGDYLAAGKPVVATAVGDIASLIEEGKCGVITQDSAEDFARGALEILEDKSDLREYSTNARKVAEEKLDWTLLTGQLEDFYFRVLNGN
jgi:glycosyltransferase involved in cell wall biosynthesis